jgi:hypothetical protein
MFHNSSHTTPRYPLPSGTSPYFATFHFTLPYVSQLLQHHTPLPRALRHTSRLGHSTFYHIASQGLRNRYPGSHHFRELKQPRKYGCFGCLLRWWPSFSPLVLASVNSFEA